MSYEGSKKALLNMVMKASLALAKFKLWPDLTGLSVQEGYRSPKSAMFGALVE